MLIKKIFLFLFLWPLVSCSPTPESIIFGQDLCDLCIMKIHDHRYGGLILTQKGKSYKFDSLECLQQFETEKLDKEEIIKEYYVFDAFEKGKLVPLSKALFLNIPKMRGPMGKAIWGSESQDGISKAQAIHGGEVLNWAQLKALLQN